jgi:hypothetical protein
MVKNVLQLIFKEVGIVRVIFLERLLSISDDSDAYVVAKAQDLSPSLPLSLSVFFAKHFLFALRLLLMGTLLEEARGGSFTSCSGILCARV